MNLTGGVLGTRPPGKPLNGLFGERFSTDKRLVEDLTGGFFWESLSGSCLVTIWPFPGLPLPGVSALQEKEVGTETGRRPHESSDALYFFREKCTHCPGGSGVKNMPALQTWRGLESGLWMHKIPWRSKWHATTVFLPGKPHGHWSLGGHSPKGHKEPPNRHTGRKVTFVQCR